MTDEKNIQNNEDFDIMKGIVDGALYSYLIWGLHCIMLVLYLSKCFWDYPIVQYGAPIVAGLILLIFVVNIFVVIIPLISEKSWVFVVMEILFALRYGICPTILLIIDCFI